jgi:hypothetical protein
VTIVKKLRKLVIYNELFRELSALIPAIYASASITKSPPHAGGQNCIKIKIHFVSVVNWRQCKNVIVLLTRLTCCKANFDASVRVPLQYTFLIVATI